MSGQPVSVVRHRGDDVLAPSRALALEQGGEDLDEGEQGSSRQVGDLHGRQRWSRVREQTGPADVVEVVSRAHAACAEAGDGAVDDGAGKIRSSDPEAFRDTRAEALQYDIGLRAERCAEPRIALEIPYDRLLARVQGVVPARRDRAKRIAVGRFHA